MITNHRGVRKLNRSNILKIILMMGPISRVRVAEMTGLKESTVSRIISKLIEEEMVYEASLDESAVGRKPINLQFNEKYGIYGLLDVTRTKTTIAVCDLSGKILVRDEIDSRQTDGESLFNTCGRKLSRMLKDRHERVLGVSTIVPCSVNTFTGNIYQEEVLGWENVGVKEILGKYFDCDIFVENNARAGALAEMYFADEAQNLSNFVFVSYRHGIGTGIVISNRVYYGAHCVVGEFGFNVLKIDGEWEDMSNLDSWENNASDFGTVKHYTDITGNRLKNNVDRQFEMILRQARKNDEKALKILRETGRNLGVGIANINWGLGPEKIIIGGKITKVWDIIFPELIGQVEKLTPYQVTPIRELVVHSSLTDYTEQGARAIVLQQMLYADIHAPKNSGLPLQPA